MTINIFFKLHLMINVDIQQPSSIQDQKLLDRMNPDMINVLHMIT